MSLPIHYLERLGTVAPCGETPGLSSSDPDTVTCLPCLFVVAGVRLVAVDITLYPFRFVCGACEQPTTRVCSDRSIVEHWTRLLRMGFPLLCTECHPDPNVTTVTVGGASGT